MRRELQGLKRFEDYISENGEHREDASNFSQFDVVSLQYNLISEIRRTDEEIDNIDRKVGRPRKPDYPDSELRKLKKERRPKWSFTTGPKHLWEKVSPILFKVKNWIVRNKIKIIVGVVLWVVLLILTRILTYAGNFYLLFNSLHTILSLPLLLVCSMILPLSLIGCPVGIIGLCTVGSFYVYSTFWKRPEGKAIEAECRAITDKMNEDNLNEWKIAAAKWDENAKVKRDELSVWYNYLLDIRAEHKRQFPIIPDRYMNEDALKFMTECLNSSQFDIVKACEAYNNELIRRDNERARQAEIDAAYRAAAAEEAYYARQSQNEERQIRAMEQSAKAQKIDAWAHADMAYQMRKRNKMLKNR